MGEMLRAGHLQRNGHQEAGCPNRTGSPLRDELCDMHIGQSGSDLQTVPGTHFRQLRHLPCSDDVNREIITSNTQSHGTRWTVFIVFDRTNNRNDCHDFCAGLFFPDGIRHPEDPFFAGQTGRRL